MGSLCQILMATWWSVEKHVWKFHLSTINNPNYLELKEKTETVSLTRNKRKFPVIPVGTRIGK